MRREAKRCVHVSRRRGRRAQGDLVCQPNPLVNPAAFQVIIVELDGHDMKKDYEVHKVISHAGRMQPFKSMGYSESQERNPTAVNIARSGIYMKQKLMIDYVKVASWFNLFSSPDHARKP